MAMQDDIPCPGTEALAQDLFICACQTNCTAECGANFCGGESAPDATCDACMNELCPSQLAACESDF